jgi:hypothetical protein|tara:strand:+ start:111 stop:332 length:222 start_codon:yes stop_codon:yes gene_type:complete
METIKQDPYLFDGSTGALFKFSEKNDCYLYVFSSEIRGKSDRAEKKAIKAYERAVDLELEKALLYTGEKPRVI